jgi:hypothetical protein
MSHVNKRDRSMAVTCSPARQNAVTANSLEFKTYCKCNIAEIYFLKFVQYVLLMLWPLRGQCILISVVFTPPSPQPPRPFVAPTCLLSRNNVSPVRACLSIWLERFRVSQKWDDRGPLRIFNSSMFDLKSFFSFSAVFLLLFSKIVLLLLSIHR